MVLLLAFVSILYLWISASKEKQKLHTAKTEISNLGAQEPKIEDPVRRTTADELPAKVTHQPIREHDLNYIKSAMRRDVRSLTPVKRPDDSIKVDLEGSFRNASMARLHPDGSIEVICFDNFGQARDFLFDQEPPQADQEPETEASLQPALAEK